MLDLLGTLFSKAGLITVRCSVCSRLTKEAKNNLCANCAEELSLRTGGFCPRCGESFGSNKDTPTTCGECRTTPPPWDNFYFHSHYDGLLRKLILGYKFHDGFGRTHLLSMLAADAFNRRSKHNPDVIIPVPLHEKRLAWRGFNQSNELAAQIGKAAGRPVLKDGLIRIRHTPPQTRLDRQERQVNIKNAFEADAERLGGKRVLLVDDVYTTGATLKECAHTLGRAGTAGVDVLVVARAQQDSI